MWEALLIFWAKKTKEFLHTTISELIISLVFQQQGPELHILSMNIICTLHVCRKRIFDKQFIENGTYWIQRSVLRIIANIFNLFWEPGNISHLFVRGWKVNLWLMIHVFLRYILKDCLNDILCHNLVKSQGWVHWCGKVSINRDQSSDYMLAVLCAINIPWIDSLIHWFTEFFILLCG